MDCQSEPVSSDTDLKSIQDKTLETKIKQIKKTSTKIPVSSSMEMLTLNSATVYKVGHIADLIKENLKKFESNTYKSFDKVLISFFYLCNKNYWTQNTKNFLTF